MLWIHGAASLSPSIRYTFWRVSEDLAGLVIRPRGVYIFRLNMSLVPSGGLPSQGLPRRAFLRDVVLIVLKDDLNNIAPLELDRVGVQSSDTSLVHASYPADRRYALTGHFGCHLLSRDQDLWFTDCDTHAASSGGPVFIQRKENLGLAAIMVGVAGTSGTIAIPVPNWVDVAAEGNCP